MCHVSLVPRPLLDFISQPWRKIGRRPAWDQNYITDRKWWTRFVLLPIFSMAARYLLARLKCHNCEERKQSSWRQLSTQQTEVCPLPTHKHSLSWLPRFAQRYTHSINKHTTVSKSAAPAPPAAMPIIAGVSNTAVCWNRVESGEVRISIGIIEFIQNHFTI